MGRNRTFDEADVTTRCAEVFRRTGHEGTSIDDLVNAISLHRGSLYKAFGSKRGLFLAALCSLEITEAPTSDALDLLSAPRERPSSSNWPTNVSTGSTSP